MSSNTKRVVSSSKRPSSLFRAQEYELEFGLRSDTATLSGDSDHEPERWEIKGSGDVTPSAQQMRKKAQIYKPAIMDNRDSGKDLPTLVTNLRI